MEEKEVYYGMLTFDARGVSVSVSSSRIDDGYAVTSDLNKSEMIGKISSRIISVPPPVTYIKMCRRAKLISKIMSVLETTINKAVRYVLHISTMQT